MHIMPSLHAISLILAGLTCSLVFAVPTSTVYVTEYTTTTTLQNSSPTIALANGILANIDIQVHELANVQALLSSITGSATINTSDYLATKSSLLAIQSSGVAIRANNQAIAPSGNAAIAGLSTVAAAQASEIALASALTGNQVRSLRIISVCVCLGY